LKHLSARPAAASPVLGVFPDFSLPDASGGRIRRADLAGKIWIADFVPAGCLACAVRSLKMADLQTSLAKAGNVRLVTFVADPVLTRPGALAEFAREYGAQPGRWLVLAGSPPVSAEKLLLVDGSGRIRGAFAGGDPAAASEILDGVGALLREVLPPPADFR
jgi:cytochrome oxidase Cu insertion factor (SCO1/SenC/PrrC family)